METDTSMESQAAGTAGAPTPHQQMLLDEYDPQNKQFKFYKSVISDYSTQVSMMNEDQHRAGRALQLATLEGDKDVRNVVAEDEQEFRMLTNQTNLHQSSISQVKKARKFPKLTGSDFWM
jgi:D-alanyl-D-alanine dipeptidase